MGASPVHILRIACSSAWELASSRAGRGGRRRRRRRRRGGHGTLTTVRTYVRSHRVCSLKGGEGGGRPFWRREQRPKSLAAAAPKNGEWEVKGVRRPVGRSVVGSPPPPLHAGAGEKRKGKSSLRASKARRRNRLYRHPFLSLPCRVDLPRLGGGTFLGRRGKGEKIDKARLKRSRSCIADSWIVALGSTVESAV